MPDQRSQLDLDDAPGFFSRLDQLGNDGDQYAVLYDPDSQLIYIWNRFRF